MEQLYLEFNKKGLEKKLDLLLKIAKEKNGDMEEAFIEFADGYIKGEMDLPVFLQAIHVSMTISGGMPNSIVRYQELLKGILKVKEYMINNNKDLDKIVNIYELLIYIYDTMYNFDEMIKISKKLLELDNKNKVALLHLVRQGQMINDAKDLIHNSSEPIEWAFILHNMLSYKLKYTSISMLKDMSISVLKEEKFENSLNLNKIDKLKPCYEYLIDIIKPYESYIDYIKQKYGSIEYMYFWHYHTYSEHINLEFFKNSLEELKELYNNMTELYNNITIEDNNNEDNNKGIKIEDLLKNLSFALLFILEPNNIIITDRIKYKLEKQNESREKDKKIIKLINIMDSNIIDFNIYKDTFVNLINEIAGKMVIDNSIEIKNEKVLSSLYEIMSVSREELIVMRLFDYVRNADSYYNMKIDKETKEQKISKIARWKGETVKINYKENEYILCYHFHTSSEVQFKDGKSIKFSKDGSNNRIKNIRRLPDENWIAINQIRDTLAHRINENDTDVNEAVRTTKKAREFIEANFTSIIECLFNVIKENGLLTDDKFNSEDF